MLKVRVGNHESYLFDSLFQFTGYLENTPVKSGRRNASHENGKSFTGTGSWDEAMNLAKYGDEELAENIRNQKVDSDRIDEVINSVKSTYELDLVGFAPHVPNYIQGIPSNMIRTTKIPLKSKIINVIINLSANCGVDKDDIIETASTYVSAIKYLELQGYRCNVYTMVGEENGSYKSLMLVKIKTDKEQMNLQAMAFPMAHTSMFRRLGFRWIELLDEDITHDSYGRPLHDEKQIATLIAQVLGKDFKYNLLNVISHEYKIIDVMERLKSNYKEVGQ